MSYFPYFYIVCLCRYLLMLKKATEENIVVGLTNIYDHFFLPTEKGNSKVTAFRLPYFEGDCWRGNAMEVAKTFEKEGAGDYEKLLKQVSNRTLKDMGHAKPSKETLVMQKVCLSCHPMGYILLYFSK
jgi:E1A/CREB-binding protein